MHASKIREHSKRVFAHNSISFFFRILFSLVFWVGYCVAFKIQVVHDFNGPLARLVHEYDRTPWTTHFSFFRLRRERNKLCKLLADHRRQCQSTHWLLWTPFHQMRSTIRMPFVPLENNHICNAINVLCAPRRIYGLCDNLCWPVLNC